MSVKRSKEIFSIWYPVINLITQFGDGPRARGLSRGAGVTLSTISRGAWQRRAVFCRESIEEEH
jgi:hypothetical protein